MDQPGKYPTDLSCQSPKEEAAEKSATPVHPLPYIFCFLFRFWSFFFFPLFFVCVFFLICFVSTPQGTFGMLEEAVFFVVFFFTAMQANKRRQPDPLLKGGGGV